MAYIGKTPITGNFVKLDAISVVNGQAAYTMQNGGSNFTAYNNVNQFLVSLNGVLQAPTDSFTVSGSTITFASNLQTGDVIDFIIVLGNSLDVGVPSDNTVSTAKLQDSSVSLAKLTATGTKDATTFLRGDNTFASAGITMADQWRLTADTNTNTDADVTTNWERVDTTLWDKLGTGMTESSGIFTFPSSGYWLVINAPTISADFNDSFASLETYFSSDSGVSYTRFSRVSSGNIASSGNTTIAVSKPDIIKVTNSSNFRMKFQTSSFGGTNTRLRGDTNYNFTLITFIKLGDT